MTLDRYWAASLVIVAFIVGSYLRLWNLGGAPLWVDEAFFCTHVINFEVNQEQSPAIVAQIIGVSDETHARLPFALCGSLTILAVYWAKPSRWTALASVVVALCPLFVFYSRMCRPYAMAGLCVALGWRYIWVNALAVLCTPLAVLGMDMKMFWRRKWLLIVSIAAAAIIILIRSDLGRSDFFTWGMFIGNPRLWYLPALATLWYLARYVMPRVERKWKWFADATWWSVLLIAVVFLPQSLKITEQGPGPQIKPWYSHVIYYNDWRGMPPVDLATNFGEITRYYTGKTAILLRPKQKDQIENVFASKDTILVGVDSYANTLSNWFFPPAVIDPYRIDVFNGKVFLMKMVRMRTGEFTVQMLTRQGTKWIPADHEPTKGAQSK